MTLTLTPGPAQGGRRAQGDVRRVRARPLLRHDHLRHHRRLRWHLGEEGLGAFPLHDVLPPLLIPPLASERHSRRVLSLSVV